MAWNAMTPSKRANRAYTLSSMPALPSRPRRSIEAIVPRTEPTGVVNGNVRAMDAETLRAGSQRLRRRDDPPQKLIATPTTFAPACFSWSKAWMTLACRAKPSRTTITVASA